MDNHVVSQHLVLLRNQIDITTTPFSARGSRLLVYRHANRAALYVNFAERFPGIVPGTETYGLGPPFLQDLVLIDARGESLAFRLVTYPHVLLMMTDIGTFRLTLDSADSLVIGLPRATRAGVQMQVNALYEHFKSLRVLTNSSIKHEKRVPVASDYRVEYLVEAGDDVALHLHCEREQGRPDAPQPFSAVLSLAERKWEQWFSKAPGLVGQYQKQYTYAWWVLGNNLVAPLGELRHEALMPSKHQYIGVWNWDAGFHAIALRHLDPDLARAQLRILIENQCANGMLPDVVHDEGIVTSIDHPIQGDVTKPPVLAWAALKIHEVDEDAVFLREIYPSLKRWNRWWLSSRGSAVEGLAHYQHPYSSGLDDNPLWDHGFPVIAPDLNTYLTIQMDSLATIAEIVGRPEEALEWRQRATAIAAKILQNLYDPDRGIFHALHDGKPIPEMTPFNLYPLWTGRMSAEIEARLVEKLTNPDLFWGPYPLSTVARNAASYSPTTMWRGPVWLNINYIFIEALQRVGRTALADQLRTQTLDLVDRNQGIHEFYHPEEGAPPIKAAPMFGWSAALFIDLCLQHEAV